MDLWWREDCVLAAQHLISNVAQELPSLKPLCNKELSMALVKIFEEEKFTPVQNFIINLVNFSKASQKAEEFSLIPHFSGNESETASVLSYDTISQTGDSMSDSQTNSEFDMDEESRSISEEELAVVSKFGTKLNTQKVLNFSAAPALLNITQEEEDDETKSYCSIITTEDQEMIPVVEIEDIREEEACVVQLEKFVVVEEPSIVISKPEPSVDSKHQTIESNNYQEDLSNGFYYHSANNNTQPALPASIQQVIKQLTPVADKSVLLSGLSTFVLSNVPIISNTYNKVVAEFKQSVFVSTNLKDTLDTVKQNQTSRLQRSPQFGLLEAARRIVDICSDLN